MRRSHGHLSEMCASAYRQVREGRRHPALALSRLWLSVHAHHATGAPSVAKVAGRVSLLPRGLDERAGQDVRRASELGVEVDPPLCYRALCQA
jgi:hypothetical protein